jgi:8-oxo-dGTP pyrophosphatase MutT (NUDIX family)
MDDALLHQLAGESGPRLRAADAVAALLIDEQGRYIMQLRDSTPEIFYPGHWGCFGGAVEPGEDPTSAMKRELREELEFTAVDPRRFTRFDFDFTPLGQSKVFREYYEVRVSQPAVERFVLHEGAQVQAFDGPKLIAHHKVTPYDAFAVWMHLYGRRMGALPSL